MKRPLLLCASALVLALAGCVTLSKSEMAALRSWHVSEPLLQRMEQRRELSIPDIIELSKKHVPDDLIIHYMEISNTVYWLRTEEVLRLRKQGVSPSLIDYMLRTPQIYGMLHSPYYYGYYDPYGPWYGSSFIFVDHDHCHGHGGHGEHGGHGHGHGHGH